MGDTDDDRGGRQQIACSLDAKGFADRRSAWRAVDRHLLSRVHERGVLRTTYPNRAGLVAELERLVRAERECCPFLDLALHADGEVVRLELRYPPGFEETLADVVADGG